MMRPRRWASEDRHDEAQHVLPEAVDVRLSPDRQAAPGRSPTDQPPDARNRLVDERLVEDLRGRED